MMRIGFLSLFAALALAAFTQAAPAQAARATVVLVWSAAEPMSSFADVRRMDVALRAPFEVGALASALHDHPGARFAIELAPDYVAALRAASADPLGAAAQTPDAQRDEHTRDVLEILTHVPTMDAAIAASNGGLALVAYALRARCNLNGVENCTMRRSEIQRAAALHAAASLAMIGSAAARALLDAPPTGADALSAAAGSLIAESSRNVAAQLDAALSSGALEVVATPDGDPVLPLLIDSGGKSASDPTAIPLDASADATMLISDALSTAAALNRARAGLASPFGAYDDAAAQAIDAAGARYAIFSDRVVRASQAGGTMEALGAALAAPYQLYDLQTSKTAHVPVLFWDDASSRALESIAPSSPPDAFANRLTALAQTAAVAAPGVPAMIALRVRMDQQWAQRADAPAVVDDVARILSARNASATPSEYIGAHPKAVPVYGFAPGSSLGSLDAFDGTPNQQALWSALAAARFAAANSAGEVKNASAQALILRAEAGMWYRAPDLPLPPDAVRSRIDDFRSLLGGVYKACGKTPPATIAPQRTPAPSPPPTGAAPKPSQSPTSAAPQPSPNPTSAATTPGPSYPQGL
jgi:hypothetical protein